MIVAFIKIKCIKYIPFYVYIGRKSTYPYIGSKSTFLLRNNLTVNMNLLQFAIIMTVYFWGKKRSKK